LPNEVNDRLTGERDLQGLAGDKKGHLTPGGGQVPVLGLCLGGGRPAQAGCVNNLPLATWFP